MESNIEKIEKVIQYGTIEEIFQVIDTVIMSHNNASEAAFAVAMHEAQIAKLIENAKYNEQYNILIEQELSFNFDNVLNSLTSAKDVNEVDKNYAYSAINNKKINKMIFEKIKEDQIKLANDIQERIEFSKEQENNNKLGPIL